jgi:hypothetical protein
MEIHGARRHRTRVVGPTLSCIALRGVASVEGSSSAVAAPSGLVVAAGAMTESTGPGSINAASEHCQVALGLTPITAGDGFLPFSLFVQAPMWLAGRHPKMRPVNSPCDGEWDAGPLIRGCGPG